MAHWSEDSKPLEIVARQLESISQLQAVPSDAPAVYFLQFPFLRTARDAEKARSFFQTLADWSEQLQESSVVCLLTTPPDAALLLPYLERVLTFQLWVTVKTTPDTYPEVQGQLPKQHAALLVLTKYKGVLKHTKTRVQYSYCPSCGKTTKDYGGKKHTYHSYGTLLSDVWRDIECNPDEDVAVILNRLADLFGMAPHQHVQWLDLRHCEVLQPTKSSVQNEALVDCPVTRLPSQLLNQDCLSALRSLPDNAIDFCFADPPYNLKKKYDKWNDALESVEYFSWCDQWLSELYRVLKPHRTLAVLNIPLWAVRHFQHLHTLMEFQDWIAWDGLSFPVRMIMPAHYAVLCFTKGAPRPLPGTKATNLADKDLTALDENYCLRASCVARRTWAQVQDRRPIADLWPDIHRLKHNSKRVDHPCQLPPTLMRRLFATFTNPGEMILDCFNGAGTSTLVAQQMERKYIGIELSVQYHELAAQRHAELLAGRDPFGKDASVPTAKNSPVQRLQKQKYAVSKKVLQLEVKRIALELGRLPTKEEVRELGQ
ncbi:MAG TPA: site-specific DNA-methyltransferase, partial [Blastocatellia bacterium]|nr:site-specific DNA-methyltransferase [Blastocatellia bacterium]